MFNRQLHLGKKPQKPVFKTDSSSKPEKSVLVDLSGAPTKTPTGNIKFTVPFRRIIKEYRHGLTCKHCRRNVLRISYSSVAPKYCSESCRRKATAKRQQKNSENN